MGSIVSVFMVISALQSIICATSQSSAPFLLYSSFPWGNVRQKARYPTSFSVLSCTWPITSSGLFGKSSYLQSTSKTSLKSHLPFASVMRAIWTGRPCLNGELWTWNKLRRKKWRIVYLYHQRECAIVLRWSWCEHGAFVEWPNPEPICLLVQRLIQNN